MKKLVIGLLAALSLAFVASTSLAATANFGWTINPVNTDNSIANVAGTVTKIYQSPDATVTTSDTLIFTSAAGAISANGVAVTANCGVSYWFAITTTADGQTSAISDARIGSYVCSTPGKPTLDSTILFK